MKLDFVITGLPFVGQTGDVDLVNTVEQRFQLVLLGDVPLSAGLFADILSQG